MIEYICDRCGKECDSNYGSIEIVTPMKLSRGMVIYNFKEVHKKIICPLCFEELRTLLNNFFDPRSTPI